MEENKKLKNISIETIIISVIISIVIFFALEGWASKEVALSDFKIESFNMETEKTNLTYSDDYMSYTGLGTISCTNTETDYIVLIEQIDKSNNEIEYIDIIVHNGKGTFHTYDSSYSEKIQKPEYEFNIIGYRSFKK